VRVTLAAVSVPVRNSICTGAYTYIQTCLEIAEFQSAIWEFQVVAMYSMWQLEKFQRHKLKLSYAIFEILNLRHKFRNL